MRTLLVHVAFVLLSLSSLAYIDKLREESKLFSKEKSIASEVGIKVVGEGGVEWDVEGRELFSVGRVIRLRDVTMRSGEYTVRAEEVLVDRIRGTAILRGGVEIKGEALSVRSESAEVDFIRSKVRGAGGVELVKGDLYAKGAGFVAHLRPLRVIITRVRTKHDIQPAPSGGTRPLTADNGGG